jgi:hypothetical protein
MELEVTWPRLLRVWWAYFWRSLVAIVVAMVLGAIVGGILGAIMGVMGVSIQTIQLVTAPLGAILGLVISVFPMKMILGKSFGEFRLVLVQTATASSDAGRT